MSEYDFQIFIFRVVLVPSLNPGSMYVALGPFSCIC